MNILFLENQPCIRALKYAEGFKKSCYGVDLYFGYLHKTLSEFYGFGDEFFKNWFRLKAEDPKPEIKKIVENYDIGLIHSHNAPDHLCCEALEAVGGKVPIIHDIHDLLSTRKTPYGQAEIWNPEKERKEEKNAIEKSDGIICASEAVRDIALKKYDCPKNIIVFRSYVLGSLIPRNLGNKLSEKDGETHIVYEGTLNSTVPGSHYYLFNIFREIAKEGVHIHIYSSQKCPSYKKLEDESRFIHYHGHLRPKDLFQEITKYDFGWTGFNTKKNEEHIDTTMPNKVLEYISCGLPVISFPHKNIKKFLIKEQKSRMGIIHKDLGVIISDISKLKTILRKANIEQIRKNVLKQRFDFTVEKNISKVLEFYNSVIKDFEYKRF